LTIVSFRFSTADSSRGGMGLEVGGRFEEGGRVYSNKSFSYLFYYTRLALWILIILQL